MRVLFKLAVVVVKSEPFYYLLHDLNCIKLAHRPQILDSSTSRAVFPKVWVQIPVKSTVFLLKLAVLENHEIFSSYDWLYTAYSKHIFITLSVWKNFIDCFEIIFV